MATPRFHVETLAPGNLRLADAEAHHARASRRLSAGDPVVLFDGRGHEAPGQVVAASRSGVDVAIARVTFRARPAPGLTLAVALPKGTRQAMLVEKCTELGVAAIQPLVTERGVAAASAHKTDRWRRTAIEAAKQSGQAWLPELSEPRTIRDVLAHRGRFDHVLVATSQPMAAEAQDTSDLTPPPPMPALIGSLADALRQSKEIVAFVGPEGGWTEAELDRLMAAGARPVSLGPNILRIETAAIALAAVIHALATTDD